VLLSPDEVLTAAHCVMPDEAPVVRCGGEDIPAEITRRDADEDLATLQLLYECATQSPSPLSELADSNPEIGSDVWAVGYPYGHAAMSKGIVSAYEPVALPPYDRQPHKVRMFLKTDLGIDPGNSGGGMFNARGEVVGICSMTRGSFGFYSPVSRIKKFLGR
jgi:serine protease Do